MALIAPPVLVRPPALPRLRPPQFVLARAAPAKIVAPRELSNIELENALLRSAPARIVLADAAPPTISVPAPEVTMAATLNVARPPGPARAIRTEAFSAPITRPAEPATRALLVVEAGRFEARSQMASDRASTSPLGVGGFDMSPSTRRLAASSGAPAPPSAGAFDRLARASQASSRKGEGQILATASFNAGIEQTRAIEHPPVPEPRITPVEILAKPRPVYTAEARALGLEGQVTLAVLFAAAGQVRVLRVERGLGHGLDEAAIRAAEKISFRAAQMDGRPIDYPAKVQIVFQLAF